MKQLGQLFLAFFQIGLFSIGGGYAVIPLIQEQAVAHFGWVSQKTYTDIITISQMTPGPLAVNTSTFVGLQISGLPGAILATLGCVLAGILISVLLFCFFSRHRDSAYVFEVLKGLKAASLGLIVSAAATLLLLAFCGSSDWHSLKPPDLTAVLLFSLGLFLLRKYKVNPILLMAAAGAAGLLLY